LWFERLSAAICIKPASIDRKTCILLNRWRRRKGGLSAKARQNIESWDGVAAERQTTDFTRFGGRS
jgi:hypothetical protein